MIKIGTIALLLTLSPIMAYAAVPQITETETGITVEYNGSPDNAPAAAPENGSAAEAQPVAPETPAGASAPPRETQESNAEREARMSQKEALWARLAAKRQLRLGRQVEAN